MILHQKASVVGGRLIHARDSFNSEDGMLVGQDSWGHPWVSTKTKKCHGRAFRSKKVFSHQPTVSEYGVVVEVIKIIINSSYLTKADPFIIYLQSYNKQSPLVAPTSQE